MGSGLTEFASFAMALLSNEWTWFAIACVVAGVLAHRTLGRFKEVGNVVVESAFPNNDTLAATSFVELIGRASRRMIVHDDGDAMENSIYNTQEVLDKVEARLQEGGFQIIFLFNSSECGELRLCQQLGANPSVTILQAPPRDRDLDVHYRILDDAEVVHLSRHRPGSERRNTKCLNLAGVPADRRVARLTAGIPHLADDLQTAGIRIPATV